MALRAGTRTVIKTVTDRFDNLRARLLQNSSLRRTLKIKEISAISVQEAAEEERDYLDTLMQESQHRVSMLRLQLEEAELDNNADRIGEATTMFNAAQHDHDRIESLFETVTRDLEHAQARVQEARDQYRAAVEELYDLRSPQEYIAQCNQYNELSNVVSNKRRDTQLANEFTSVVNMQ